MRLQILAAGCLTALALTPAASALTDFWVNPAAGSNSHPGTDPGAPLQTIGEATGRALPGDVVFLAPGTYSEATGEAFPIEIPPGVQVESTAGRAVTLVDAMNAGPAGTHVFRGHSGSSLVGVTVERSDRTHLACDRAAPELGFRAYGCAFVGGESVVAAAHGGFELEGCVLRDQSGASVALATEENGATLRVRIVDCDLLASWRGLQVYTGHFDGDVEVEVLRCRLMDHARAAILVANTDIVAPRLWVGGCLIVGNRTGVEVTDGGFLTPTQLVMEHCTVAGNFHHGLDLRETKWPESVVRSCIIAGNAFSDAYVQAYLPIQSEDNLVADGSLWWGAVPGDPRFIAAASGDYRLRADSPCVDSGAATSLISGVDMDGRPRNIDGDLDLAPASDMGAFEFAPLVGPDVLRVGQPALIGMSGPAGSFSSLVVAPDGFAPFGITTPYGRLFLAVGGTIRVTPVMTTGGSPTWVDISSVLDPSWIGTSIGLQALPRSAAAPAGGALTNPLLIPVE